MAVYYKRDYELIIGEFVEALKHIERFYTFLDMDDLSWRKLDKEEQGECLKTMSHDIIYGLGGDPTIEVEEGTIIYEREESQIKVIDHQNRVHIISLE